MSNLVPPTTAEPCSGDPAKAPTLQALPGRLSDLGGLPIRRLLPRSQRRLVGPWCFLDTYGPLSFASGQPMDVAPHPHIGLQTVSWLLEGEVQHLDSLGRQGLAVPGVLNLMTAGRGIAHAEQTPPQNAGRLRGVQLWVALPDSSRGTAPSFEQHHSLPRYEVEAGQATVILGELGGVRSPGRVFWPLVAVDIAGAAAGRLCLPLEPGFEYALVPLQGDCQLDAQQLAVDTLYYMGSGRRQLVLDGGGKPYRGLLLGGAPFEGTILMWWNFVARTSDELVAAREDWQAGRRFGEVRTYKGRRLEAPPFVARPVQLPPAGS
jgi:redox-sensitive bicupin YhaK (pirin superfamily)